MPGSSMAKIVGTGVGKRGTMPQEFVKVAEAGNLKPGEKRLVRIADERILLCNYEGKYYAVNDTCTHANGSLSRGLLHRHEVACPLHGASFDVRTGEVLTPPAMERLTVYAVKIEGDNILIGPPSP